MPYSQYEITLKNPFKTGESNTPPPPKSPKYMPSWQYEYHLKNPFRSKTPPPPPSLKILVLPAGIDRPYRTSLPLIETHIRRAKRSTDPHQEEIFRTASAASMMYHYNESLCEPNIRILPDALQSGHWDQRAWEKRCVIGTAKYHLFYTLCPDFYGFGFLQGKNSTFGDVVMGDVFMLKVSDSTDEDGLNSYVDVERDDCVQEVLLDLGKKLGEQGAFK